MKPATGEAEPGTGAPLLDVRNLTVSYLADRDPVTACDDVSFTVRRGEILGVAGESGCGKSTLLAAVTRLQRPPAVTTGGQVLYRPTGAAAVDLVGMSERELRRLRWRELSIVMQNGMDCLNPVMRLHEQFADVMRQHDPNASAAAMRQRIHELLRMVGIPADRSRSYPHELSGGMRQRSLIALSLACDPELIVMDEPTTAVDVVMQRQILAQLVVLKRRLDFAVVFVTHDLSLLLELADRIAIMYAGRLVELGSARDLYRSPRHPYAKGLRDAFPPLRAPRRKLSGLPGSPPDLGALGAGCAFAPRCPHAFEACVEDRPELITIGAQQVACHLYDQTADRPNVPADLATADRMTDAH